MPFRFASDIEARLAALEFEFRSRLTELNQQVHALQARFVAQLEDRSIAPLDGEVRDARHAASIGQSGEEEAAEIAKETGSAAEPMGELEASLTPRPHFDRKANHRRYMREWRRKRAALRKS
jgi:hypothetical protein